MLRAGCWLKLCAAGTGRAGSGVPPLGTAGDVAARCGGERNPFSALAFCCGPLPGAELQWESSLAGVGRSEKALLCFPRLVQLASSPLAHFQRELR